jgi:hypothetical protein
MMGPWAPATPATSYPETFFFAPEGWKPPKQMAERPLDGRSAP